MELGNEIMKEHSKNQTMKIVRWIGRDKNRFKELMESFLHGGYVTGQHSAWILSQCGRKYPELLEPYILAMLKKTREKNIHTSVKRNVMRVLENYTLPEDVSGLAADIAFTFLADRNEPVAVRVFAMSVLYNISKREPGLKNELRLLIEGNFQEESAGFKSRGRKILSKLKG